MAVPGKVVHLVHINAGDSIGHNLIITQKLYSVIGYSILRIAISLY